MKKHNRLMSGFSPVLSIAIILSKYSTKIITKFLVTVLKVKSIENFQISFPNNRHSVVRYHIGVNSCLY
jgi:hypothetical protein